LASEHFDMVIVGAGLSGIGAAWHLQTRCPGRTYAILEGREEIGGTWSLFRYPGIRSDSDMYTLGYSFRPWKEAKAIADGPSILKYVNDTADDANIRRNIRFNNKVTKAEWSTPEARWTVTAEVGPSKELVTYTCNFLMMCSGYYKYAAGYTPDFAGLDHFKGQMIHPQHWPDKLDYSGKQVVVIGSGATAVTIVPEMAKTAAHVTMLQRSPTYVVSRPAEDALANWLRKWLPPMLAYRITRWKNVSLGMFFFNRARKEPEKVKAAIIDMVQKELGPDYDVAKHFTPRYNPWDQRLCLVPDADLFASIRDKSASVVTDTIDTFTESGIKLTSGEELKADIVVSATGLELEFLGGVAISVDGKAMDPAETYTFRGMMYSGVPNLASVFGYTNASWTLKADLTCEHVCRMLNYMKSHNLRIATPRLSDAGMEQVPWLDFSSGYVQRSVARFPRQGSRKPWKLHQNYALDIMSLRFGKLVDPELEII
jgi:monooxygenase